MDKQTDKWIFVIVVGFATEKQLSIQTSTQN